MTPRFAEKVALVTGAGSGMGRAITIRLAEEGASVLAVDIDGERLEEVAALFAFLASDEARSITGAIYTLDNGLTAS